MTATDHLTEEAGRIRFLIERDGRAAARQWVRETLDIYRTAVASPRAHASNRFYRPAFERSISDFETWLAAEEDRDE